MKQANEILETLVDTQKKSIETFVDNTEKFKEALKTGKTIETTSEICQDWWNSQLEFLNGITSGAKTETEKTINSSSSAMEDFYKNLFDSQVEMINKTAEYNLSLFNKTTNFGKDNFESKEQFEAIQTNWNQLFESWTKSLNSTYSILQNSLPTNLSNELFQTIFNTNTLYAKLQDFFKPFLNAMKEDKMTAESFTTFLNPESYKKITEETFKVFFGGNNINSLVESNIQFAKKFFEGKHTFNKDYTDFWKVFSENFPNLLSSDYTKYNKVLRNISVSYNELFDPMLKLVSNTKEKETIQLTIDTLDKSSEYAWKLTEIQTLLYTTGQKVAEELGLNLYEKAKKADFHFSSQTMFNDWVSINEKHYSLLFGTEAFSKLKAELLTISLDINKNIEKQFENRIEFLPLVVKSELDELYQTIHDLKKTIKNLEQKYSEVRTSETKATEVIPTEENSSEAKTNERKITGTTTTRATTKKASV